MAHYLQQQDEIKIEKQIYGVLLTQKNGTGKESEIFIGCMYVDEFLAALDRCISGSPDSLEMDCSKGLEVDCSGDKNA